MDHEIFTAIKQEIADHAYPEKDDTRSSKEWQRAIERQLRDMQGLSIQRHDPIFRRRMLKIAAIAVAAVKSYDREELRLGIERVASELSER